MPNRLYICLALMLPPLLLQTTVLADSPLIITPVMNGPRLGIHIDVLEDPSGDLDLDAVRSGKTGAGFAPGGRDYLSFGYTRSTYWARLETSNGTGQPIRWLLELDTSHMDSVELHSPDESGRYSARRAGDTVPFHEREVEYRTFVFSILEQPGTRTYYLRFRTEGSMDIHLRAWSPVKFMGKMNRETPVLWIFYSFILIMACYNLYMFFSIKKPSYLYFSLFIASYLILQMVLDGSSFQFL